MTSHLNFLWLATPAVIMFIAAYWRQKLIFWAGALASVGLTRWLMLVAEQARVQSLIESEGVRAVIERDVPLTWYGPVIPVALTLLWGGLAWYIGPWFMRRRPQA
jgi:hypothetical protein